MKNPFLLGWIPNHPEISINTLTQQIDNDSKKYCPKVNTELFVNESILGLPNEKKLAWTTKTKNIAIIRNASIFDSLFFDGILILCIIEVGSDKNSDFNRETGGVKIWYVGQIVLLCLIVL